MEITTCLGFDWEKDVQSAVEPPSYTIQPRQVNPTDPKDDRYWLVGGDSYRLVQADPNDILHISDPVSGEHHYHVNKMIWMNTIDRYLFQYMQLIRKQHGDIKQAVDLPDMVADKLYDYLAASNSRRKKPPHFVQLPKLDSVIEENKECNRVEVPSFAPASYLNAACRWVLSRSDSIDKQSSLYYDGIVLRMENEKKDGAIDIIPQFSLADYVEHELLTGISLSIEIASVLLEIKSEKLREAALEAFCTRPVKILEISTYIKNVKPLKAIRQLTPLDICVRSPCLFTRNAAARNFFQQIIMETSVQLYEWKGLKKSESKSLLEEDTVQRAISHLNILIPNVGWEHVPDNQIQEAIDQIYMMLLQVTIPVNLPDYVKNPQNGLAAFCHPKHKNVDLFLNELEIKERDRITEIPRCRTKAHKWFKIVHSAVKASIRKLNS